MILGLHGLPGCGKDTVAERAAQFTSLPIERRSFADKLKRSCAALFDISITEMETLKRQEEKQCVELWGTDGILYGFTMRQILQRYGTEAHREIFGTNFWLDQCLPIPYGDDGSVLDPSLRPNRLIIITDVRFPNEAERVLALGGRMVEVIGPDFASSEHASDKHIGEEYIGYRIMNQTRDDGFKLLDGQLEILLAHLGLRNINNDEVTTASVGSRD